jgi:hypothetical protein
MWQVKRPALMAYPEDLILRHALRRLVEVFGVPESSLSREARFGHELKAVPASDFKSNEFDVIDNDIKDVADRRLLKEMAQGLLVIRTVRDYCEHMVRCSSVKPEEVARVLRLPAAD